MTVRALALTLLATLVLGCGEEPAQEPPDPTKVKRPLPQPMLRMVAPTAVRVGELVSIFGQGFADKEVGQTRLTFEGIFQTTSGRVNQVNLEVVPDYENQGVVNWTFGPNIPFTSEEETGTFRGIVKAKNVGYDGEEKHAPQALGAEIQVLPSILIRQMRPLGAGCPVGITASTAETKFYFEFKAIGLKSGSDLAPLRFVYTFLKEHFQFKGYLSDQLGMDPESLFPEEGPVSIVDDVHNGDISKLGSGVPKNVYVFKGNISGTGNMALGSDKLFGLTDLMTAPVPDVVGNYSADYFDAMMNVVAVDSAGQEAKRSVPLRIWSPIEVRYDGNSVPVRSYDPVPVSGCIPGGKIGRDVTYTEMTAETRTRSFKFIAKVGGGFDIKVFRLNAEFGIEVNSEVTSAKSKDLKITGKILPGEFAAFYRQTIQLERTGNLVGHGPCGSTQDLGEVVVTDWIWSPDLAKNRKCPPLPPSNLPPGQDF